MSAFPVTVKVGIHLIPVMATVVDVVHGVRAVTIGCRKIIVTEDVNGIVVCVVHVGADPIPAMVHGILEIFPWRKLSGVACFPIRLQCRLDLPPILAAVFFAAPGFAAVDIGRFVVVVSTLAGAARISCGPVGTVIVIVVNLRR
jgi:hypothetical protein